MMMRKIISYINLNGTREIADLHPLEVGHVVITLISVTIYTTTRNGEERSEGPDTQ